MAQITDFQQGWEKKHKKSIEAWNESERAYRNFEAVCNQEELKDKNGLPWDVMRMLQAVAEHHEACERYKDAVAEEQGYKRKRGV